MNENIDGKLILFGYRLENGAEEKYEFSENTDKQQVIKEIKAKLSNIKNYTENSKIAIEMLIVSKLDHSLPTVSFDSLHLDYHGFKVVTYRPVYKKLDVKAIDQFINIMSKTWHIVKFDSSRWNADGTFSKPG